MAQLDVLKNARGAPVCVVIACVMVLAFALSFIRRAVETYPVTLGLVMNGPDRKWDVLTFVLAESRFVYLALDVFIVIVFGPVAELSMGSGTFLRYIVSVAIPTGICSIFPYLLLYVVSPWSSNPLEAVQCGGLVMAEMVMFAVAACETTGASVVVAPSVLPKMRLQQWPFMLLLLSLVETVLGVVFPVKLASDYIVSAPLIACSVGFWFSWAFMRFLYHQTVPTFALHMFFYPAPLRNAVKSLGVTAQRLCGRGWLEEDVSERVSASASVLVNAGNNGGDGNAGRILLPGSTPEDADRRRAIALAALANRIHQQREQTGTDNAFPPKPSQRAAGASAAPQQEPDDDHKENAEV